MAGFIMKQMVGDKLGSVKGALGGDEGGGSSAGGGGMTAEEEAEVEAARQEIEDQRKEKHRKAEMEREKMRSNIRDKYNLKKEDQGPQVDMSAIWEDCAGGGTTKPTVKQLGDNDGSLQGQVLGYFGQAKTAAGGAMDQVSGFASGLMGKFGGGGGGGAAT